MARKEDMTEEQRDHESQRIAKLGAGLKKERWRQVMAMPQAQDLMFDLLEECSVFRLSYHPSGAQTAFNEGERSVALKLMAAWIDASPDTFFNTMKQKKGMKNV